LRPLSGLKSFWGRIWKKPPEAVTAKRRQLPPGPPYIYKRRPGEEGRKVHTGITAQIDKSVVGLRADKENVREDLIQNCSAKPPADLRNIRKPKIPL
jgi:hypothetical protein